MDSPCLISKGGVVCVWMPVPETVRVMVAGAVAGSRTNKPRTSVRVSMFCSLILTVALYTGSPSGERRVHTPLTFVVPAPRSMISRAF